MKKTININLGGQAFIIDESAYEILHNYFEALKQKFTNDSEQKEILTDIESRIAEMFTQRLGRAKDVVNEEDVIHVISIMGKPEDIAGEASVENETPTNATTQTNTTFTGKVEKKLFRDMDDKKVGGVISGLCHYFGIKEPSWIRIGVLALVALSIFGHTGGILFPLFVIYMILLIVIPKAQSSSEKLQMRGEPVTINNIEREVRDAVNTAASSVNKIANDYGISGKRTSTAGEILKAIAKILVAIVLVNCVGLLFALTASFFGLSILSSASLSEITQLVVPNSNTIMLWNVGLLLTFGIPLIAIMYAGIRFIVESKTQNTFFKRGLWVGWIVGIFLLVFTSWGVGKNFMEGTTYKEKVQLMQPKNGTLLVQLADTVGHPIEIKNDSEDESFHLVMFGNLLKTENGFAVGEPKIELLVSPDTNFYIEKIQSSQGRNTEDALKNAKAILYKFSQSDTTVNLDNKFEITKKGKWRFQKMKIRIYIPEGKHITFGKNIDELPATVKGNDYFDDVNFAEKTFTTESGKIKCPKCDQEVVESDTITENIQEDIDTDDLKDVNVNVSANGVSIKGKTKEGQDIQIKVNEDGAKVVKTDSLGKKQIIKTKKQ